MRWQDLSRLANEIRQVVFSVEAEMKPNLQSLVMRIRDRFNSQRPTNSDRDLAGPNPNASSGHFGRGWSPAYKM